MLASSDGYLSFYSSLGNNVYNISPKTVSHNPNILEAGDAVASMMFSKPNGDNEKCTHEFTLVTYSGLLKSYRLAGTHGYTFNYEFSFGNFYRNGVNAFAYDRKHNLYLVAGNTIMQNLNVVPATIRSYDKNKLYLPFIKMFNLNNIFSVSRLRHWTDFLATVERLSSLQTILHIRG